MSTIFQKFLEISRKFQKYLELSRNLVSINSNVALIDDLLATGGSALAANDLISKSGSLVKNFLFVIELLELNGRKKLPKNSNVFTVVED